MTLDEIYDRDVVNEQLAKDNMVYTCADDEIYDKTFNAITNDLNIIDNKVTAIEHIVGGMANIFLNKGDDGPDGPKPDYIYDYQFRLMDELFPNAEFEVCIDINKLDDIITTKKEVKLIQTFTCYCYNNSSREDKVFVIKSNEPMTTRYVINELIKQNFKLECNHHFLESLDAIDNIVEYSVGS